jgi:hypothetical protein
MTAELGGLTLSSSDGPSMKEVCSLISKSVEKISELYAIRRKKIGWGN